MTVHELLSHRKTRYLFRQNGCNYYSCGYRFFKIEKGQVMPVDLLKGGLK